MNNLVWLPITYSSYKKGGALHLVVKTLVRIPAPFMRNAWVKILAPVTDSGRHSRDDSNVRFPPTDLQPCADLAVPDIELTAFLLSPDLQNESHVKNTFVSDGTVVWSGRSTAYFALFSAEAMGAQDWCHLPMKEKDQDLTHTTPEMADHKPAFYFYFYDL